MVFFELFIKHIPELNESNKMENSITHLISNYQQEVMRIKNAFYTKFSRHDILNAFKEKSIAREGNIVELGILYYYFHGNSLYTLVSDKVIEFDFSHGDEVDFWNLKKLAQSQSHKYKALLEGNRLKEDFKQLLRAEADRKICPFRRYSISLLLINKGTSHDSPATARTKNIFACTLSRMRNLLLNF